ncbi:MAG: Carboxypeptidase [Chlorobi bacterium]|nr:Carboxypeptidase [Chlorobiota bacterium]
MKSFAISLFVLALLLLPRICSAQKEFNVWCFGFGAGIDFNGPAPVSIDCVLKEEEGSASIADRSTGALLFYTDGVRVRRKDNVVMLNGDSLRGNPTSTQSALIVPKPGDDRGYYLFTADAGAYDHLPNLGINYSLIDMRLDGGRGAVTRKNIRILDSAAEKLTTVRNSDGCSYWILAHGWGSDGFYAWRLSDTGLAPPVISSIGIVHQDHAALPGVGSIGVMKPSPDGRRLAVLLYDMRIAQLFDFDPATGIISNPITIAVDGYPYGASFSPDNGKLYISAEPNQLVQYDVRGADSAAIAATEVLISDSTDVKNYDTYGMLQLAPDGRIYHARNPSRWIGAIVNPNASGTACDYRFNALDLGPRGRSVYGLPNLIESYFVNGNLLCGGPAVSFTGPDTICAGESVQYTDRSTNGPTGWAWSFPGGSPAAWSDRIPPELRYDTPGSYPIRLAVTNPVGTSTVERTLTVLPRGEIRTRIATDYTASPGDTVLVAVRLESPVDMAALHELDFSLRYTPGMLRLDTVLLAGALLNGWSVDSLRNDAGAGTLSARFTAPRGRTLSGTGNLLMLRFLTFLDSADSSALKLDLHVPGIPCVVPLAQDGFIRLPVCGSRNRLIVATGDPYQINRARPDPTYGATEIIYSLGLDGPTALTIFNERGEQVGALVNGYQPAGRHSIVWNPVGLPSGLYFYRIVSGDWSRTGTVLLAR